MGRNIQVPFPDLVARLEPEGDPPVVLVWFQVLLDPAWEEAISSALELGEPG
jgi:sirohydrochlorin ferrochelatase